MIDITDESYESDLSEEESNKLLLMCGHAVGPKLSPAAQAVAWAYDNTPEKETGNHRYHWLAAALRAAADQMSYAGADEAATWLTEIAAELEGQ